MPRRVNCPRLLLMVRALGVLSQACAASGPARQTELLPQRDYRVLEQTALPAYYR